MRARLAVLVSGQTVALREVVLRDKPSAFLEASPSGTVPCLVTDATVIDESLDIMVWALQQHDPDQWLAMPPEGWEWIARCDGPFKQALDRTKYATRYPEADPEIARAEARAFLVDLDAQLTVSLFGKPCLADYAILPFVRQFAFIDQQWFAAQDWPRLQRWLAAFLASHDFARIMPKYAQWAPQDAEVLFP